jgi:hypothetical protein
VNRARLHHPLGDAVPALGRWLNLPAAAPAGGSNVVRVAIRVRAPRCGSSWVRGLGVVELRDAGGER